MTRSPNTRFTDTRSLAPLLLALVVFATGSPAHAEPSAEDSERANALFKKGKAAYNDGNAQEAYRLYSEAWSLKQSPDIAANLAQTEADLHMAHASAEHFAFALDHLLPSSTEEQKKALNEGLELEKKELGTIHVTVEPADAQLTLDGAPVTPHGTGDLYVEPGEHRCGATRDGYQKSEQVVRVSKGGAQVLWLKLKPGDGAAASPSAEASAPLGVDTAPPPAADAGGTHERSLVPVVIGGVVAALGTAGFIGFELAASSANKDREQLRNKNGLSGCADGSASAADCAAQRDAALKHDRDRNWATVSAIVGAVGLVSIPVYLLWPRGSGSAQHAARSLRVQGAVTDRTGALWVSGEF